MDLKNKNWTNGKLEQPSLNKEVLWFIKIKQDITVYGSTSHRLYPFWSENVYTFISEIKTNANGKYLTILQPDGEELKVYMDEDVDSLIDCFWIECPN